MLPAEEGRHLVGVLRLRVGDQVAVFDGRGREFTAVVASIGRPGVSLALAAPRRPAPEPAVAISLAQVVLKGEMMDRVVRDLVMMGGSDIQPVVSARAETSLAALGKARRVERWQRIAVASAKQCGRAVVPPVHDPVTISTLLEEAAAGDGAARLMLLEPSQPHGEPIRILAGTPAPRAAVLLVGPEGGWAAAEVDRLASAGFRPLTLGPRTLRADAAPIVALALLRFIWGDL